MKNGQWTMSEITVRNPPLMDRLRIQAVLRKTADTHGEDRMLELLAQALTTEFHRQDIKYQHDKDQLRQKN